MEPTVYELIEPIEFGSEKITKIELKPMKAKHLRAIKGDGSIGELLDLAGKLSGLTREEIDEMGAEDAGNVAEIIAGFLGRGPKAGKKSTQP